MKFKFLIWIFILIIGVAGIFLVLATSLVTQNVKQVDIGWRTFQQDRSEKARLTSSLRTSVGYGGMIHHFKNYVLRQNIDQMDKAQEHLGAANNLIEQYRVLGVSEQEVIALDDIQAVLENYSVALLSAKMLIQQHKTPIEIDRLIKVDDNYAFRGLEVLDKDLELINRSYGDAYIHTKTKDLTALKGVMGYGGMIHEFKNYVLRQDESRKDIVFNKISTAKKIIQTYKEHELSLAETIALEDIENTLNHYELALNNVFKFVNKQLTPRAIDQQVKVDDLKAIRGFIVLEREIARKITLKSQRISRQLAFSTQLGKRVTWAITVLLIFTIIFSLWVLYSKLIKPLSELNRNMEMLAQGDLSLSIKGADKNNEIGDMAKSLVVFKHNALLKQAIDKELEAKHAQLLIEVENKQIAQRQLEKEREGLEAKIKLRTNDLLDAKEEAIHANKAKTQFLSRMSHELRTPLNVIFGFSDLLATDEVDPLSDGQTENLTEITCASAKLLVLIDEILELSDIELGNIQLETSEILICPLIQDSVNYLSSLVDGRNIDVLYPYSCNDELTIFGDGSKVQQILQTIMNYVANNGTDGHNFNIYLEKNTKESLKLFIIIPACILTEAEQVNIFEAFIEDDLLDSGQSSLGMSMPIVKQLVELMQGSIGVSSSPELGTTLWIEFKTVSA